MPTSKAASLDPEAWTSFQPKERLNDFEYNQLLYKYKALCNEMRELKQLHCNCSLAGSSSNSVDIPSFGTSNSNNPAAAADNNGNCNAKPKLPKANSNGQFVINKISYFQHQNSVPSAPSSTRTRDQLNGQDSAPSKHTADQNLTPRHRVPNFGPKHYNSSHNLLLFNSNNQNTGNLPNRSEVRQSNPSSNYRLMHSKSSERLDLANNNHLTSATGTKDHDLPAGQTSRPKEVSLARDDNYPQNDANIYDAVSPDDQLAHRNDPRPSVTSSIHNLSRLSLGQRAKLDSSKSSLGFGSGQNSDNNRQAYTTLSSTHFPTTRGTPAENHDRERSNNSFGSSIILDASNNTSSSLSLLTSQEQANQESPQYANYVNIDFFLKRGASPTGDDDDLEEDVTNANSSEVSDDEDATQMSHSFSSDQICEDALKDLSPRELAKRLSSKVNTNSSSSLTPASSADFLDENRSSTIVLPSSASARFAEANSKLASFFSSNNRDFDGSNQRKSSTSPRDLSSKSTPIHKTLGPIHESGNSFMIRQISLDPNHLDGKGGNAFAEAHSTMRSFLSDLNLSPVDDVFEDKAQRRIVKESFAVEFCGRRKLRHLFLFNDVIVCAKYQASSKQKFTFDVKWYLNLTGVSVLDPNDTGNQVKYDKEAIENQILAIRTNLMLLRGQMQQLKRSKHKQPSKTIKKLKKKRTELEAELVLLLPHLPLVIKHANGKKYTFFLSSNFDRNQWIESIKFLQSQLDSSKGSSMTPSSSELQAWIQTCRKNLNPSLGTFLLRSNCDDDLLYGDLYMNLGSISGIGKPGTYYFCFEVDSYGHFSQKASSSVMRVDGSELNLNDEYIFPLDGAHTLRILLYEDLGLNMKPSVIGKAHIELSRAWFLDKPVDKVINFNSNCSLAVKLSYSSSELLSMRIPHAKLCPTFGMDITQVCKKEKTHVPLLIQLCVDEVERRGMREVGIYRMSGTSTDIQRLKRAFETNPYVAELLLRDIDINSVTGFLKTYLREMPEGLFINKLYLKFVAAFNIPQSETAERTRTMIDLFHRIPITNQHTIIYLVEHLVKVNKYENYNKMSLTNLATVIGPNILRPPTETSGSNSSDPFTAVVIGSMSQAGILYFFLNRKYQNLPLTELDPSELQAPHPSNS